MTNGIPSQAGTHVTTTTVKTEPLPDEIEVYNTNRDPTEMDNLAGSSGNAGCCGSAPTQLLLLVEWRISRLGWRSPPNEVAP